MRDVVDRARDYLADVFDREPERYAGARGVIRELIIALESERAQ